MLIYVNDPQSKQVLELEAIEEMLNGRPAWRIRFPSNHSCLLLNVNHRWEPVGEHMLSPELLENIERALHPLAIRNFLNQRNLIFCHQL